MKLIKEDLQKNTRKELASKIGISYQCLQRFLNYGIRTPKVVKAIAKYYNITISEVLENEDNK